MELKDDFEKAVTAVGNIDFTVTEQETLNTFETTIRYLGGLLSAYDLSEGKYPVLLDKAVELGDMLYAAFDTPNRMPITRWSWRGASEGTKQEAGEMTLLAEIGSLTLEFTRLTQLTGDPRFFDAVQRIMDIFEAQQQETKMPGLWPVLVNAKKANFTEDTGFTLGAMADSLYEYFPKQHLLLGGRQSQSRALYTKSIDTAKKTLFFRPMTPDNAEILISGNARAEGNAAADIQHEAVSQHLSCFVGGMVALGAMAFSLPEDIHVAKKLVDGCIWAYESMDTAIMPEVAHLVACANPENCQWSEHEWHSAIFKAHKTTEDGDAYKSEWIADKIEELRLKPGYYNINDRRYILR
jgi:mannosyl-oligosaccharide alpha-1,2-mannosidase